MQQEAALQRSRGMTMQAVSFSGVWINELNSEMELSQDGPVLTGTYRSAVSAGGGGVNGTISGFVNGDLIAFVVNWPRAALTAWVGQLVDEGTARERIATLWQMTTNIAELNEPDEMWKSILAGSDRFSRKK